MVPGFTYHSRFIPEGIANASQIFFRDAHDIPKYFTAGTSATGKQYANCQSPCDRNLSQLLFIVLFRTWKSLTPKDVMAVKGLIV
jgi:hypothetical protein